ncbi:MAG: alpha/beta hydrolase [Pseudomonadota bacterium]
MRSSRGYVDAVCGQLHFRSWGVSGSKPDLYLLHPAPYSGLAWLTIAPLLAHDRRVIAPDFPGYGGSDALSGEATIDGYCQAMQAVAERLSVGLVDVVGFHSGCLVAAEWGRAAPDTIAALVLLDVPAFDGETRVRLLDQIAPITLSASLDSLQDDWAMAVTRRYEHEGLARSVSMFAEMMRAGAGRNDCFRAAFSYPVEQRLAAVSRPATVVTTGSSLLEASRRAVSLLPDAISIELPEITTSVLDANAEQTAATLLDCLS